MFERYCCKMKSEKINNLFFASLFLGFTVCIYAPFELYLTNRQEFWFSLSQFVWLPFIVAGAAIAFAVLIGILIKRWVKLYHFYLAGIFGIGIACYLQGNFLNLKVGLINGAVIDWSSYKTRIICNCIVWALIIIAILIFSLIMWEKCNKLIGIISLFLAAVQMISLITLFVIKADQYGEAPTTQYLSREGLFEISSDENILIFLMDAFDDAYMKEIISKYPEALDELNGFTYFSNMVGSYPNTLYAAQYLLSGYYNLNEAPYHEWTSQLNNKHLYWEDLTDLGWNYYIYEGRLTYMPPDTYSNSQNYEKDVPLKIANYSELTHDLYQLVACKYLPDLVKPFIWPDGSEFDFRQPAYGEYEAYSYYNKLFINEMQDHPITVKDNGKNIKFIHLEGCHSPNYLNENGQVQDVPNDYVDNARGCLKIIGNILDQLREKDCFDNTAIIIMADHGCSDDGVLANPVFMVKPQNAENEPMKISNAPVSHRDYPATILQLAGYEDYQPEYGYSVFDIEEDAIRDRYYYQHFYSSEWDGSYTLRLIEYSVAPESNDRSSFSLTDVEYMTNGEIIQHSKYCKLCKAGGITQAELEKYDPPREIHEKDNNYPLNN